MAFIHNYMWLSKFFWLLALVKDAQHRLTKVHGIWRVSSKKIQQSHLSDDEPPSQVMVLLYSILTKLLPRQMKVCI